MVLLELLQLVLQLSDFVLVHLNVVFVLSFELRLHLGCLPCESVFLLGDALFILFLLSIEERLKLAGLCLVPFLHFFQLLRM